MKLLKLPDYLRKELSRPVGILVEGSNYREVAERVKNLILKRRSWCIGDVVVRSMLDINFIPDVAIIDRRTIRETYIDSSYVEEIYTRIGVVYRIYNPPGHINPEIRDLIESIYRCNKKTLVIVVGEEDLLSLAIIAYGSFGDAVVYGLPSRGVVVIYIDEDIKRKALEVISLMTPVDA
ncbi:MAG: DUF359 domain-containing protein [Sulfolobales archaeon]